MKICPKTGMKWCDVCYWLLNNPVHWGGGPWAKRRLARPAATGLSCCWGLGGLWSLLAGTTWRGSNTKLKSRKVTGFSFWKKIHLRYLLQQSRWTDNKIGYMENLWEIQRNLDMEDDYGRGHKDKAYYDQKKTLCMDFNNSGAKMNLSFNVLVHILF